MSSGPHTTGDGGPDPAPPGSGGHTGQYFEVNPLVPHRPRMVELHLADLSLELMTDSGVFSADRIDSGTKLLLIETGREPTVTDLPEGDLVDVGAGYGPIAISLALRNPDRSIWAVEPNERARELCEANATAAGVAPRVRVVTPDAVPADLHVAGIFSNPPIRVGKAALHDLLERWLCRLAPGGEAWLVVQRNLGADSLATWLRGNGHGVQRHTSRRGYRLLRVGRPTVDQPAED